MSAAIASLTDNNSWDQRVAPAEQCEKRVSSRKDLCKRFQEIRLTANTFLEEYDYEVTCCGKRTKYVARVFHLTLTFLSLAAGILYVMDSMNYTYCKNKCPTPENLKLSVIGAECTDKSHNKSLPQLFCTYHVYKGFFDSLTFSVLDYLLTAVFTIELLLRAIVSPGLCRLPAHLKRRNANKDYNLKPFFHDPLIYFDIISVVPTYFELLLLNANNVTNYGTTNSIVNALKVLRVCRLFKTLRSFSGTKVIVQTVQGSCGPLSETLTPIVVSVFILGGSLLVLTMPCNGVVGTEHCEIADLWSAGYFIVITLTTVGYGDMVPFGDLARSLVIIFMMFGTLLLAIPLAIIGNKFADAFDKKIPVKRARGVGNFGFRTPLVDTENERVRQQRLLNSAMMMYARILSLERRLEDGTETLNQKTHDLMVLNSLHQEIAQDTVSHMPIIDRHSKSIGDLGLQFANKVTVTRVRLPSVSKIQPVTEPATGKTCFQDEQAISASSKPHKPPRPARKRPPARVGSFRVRDLVNCCSRQPNRRVLQPSWVESDELEALRNEARISSSWRDKMWLILNHPRENKVAFMMYLVRSLLVFAAIVVCALETLSTMNFYGSETVLCQDVVDQYCAKVASLDTNWRYTLPTYAMNFQKYENVTRDEFIRINNFCFPDVCDNGQTTATHACSDPSKITAYVPKTSCLAPHPQNSNLTKCGFSLQEHVSLVSFCSYRGVSVSGQHYRLDASAMAQELVGGVPVCQRLACQDNSASRGLANLGETGAYSAIAGLELFFAIVFFIEITLRLASMRSPKRFFTNVINWVELLAAVGAIVELTVYCVGMQSFTYTVWGLAHPMWLFYQVDTFRLLRVLVVIRFLVMQQKLHSMTLIVRTFKIAMPKVMIALYFMFLFISIFAGLFFTFETVLPCTVEWVHANKEPFNQRTYSDPDAMVLRYVYREHTMHAGEVCPIQDVMDGLWLAVVTWSTVGYGGLYPRTLTGQVIAMACCLLGLCYTCMPLTIFGSTFYTHYMKKEDTQTRVVLTMEEKTHVRRRFGKVVNFISAGVHIKAKSNGTLHHLSERELQVYQYTYRCKLPHRVGELSLERVQQFKAQHLGFMQALAFMQAEDRKYNEERII